MSPASDPLIDVAAAVADGTAVDWAAASDASAEDSGALNDLKIIAGIAAVHRRIAGDEGFCGGDAAESSAVVPEATEGRARGDGTPWGPLRILQPVGSGSFGEVFRAWDTQLDREVALKILRNSRPTAGDSAVREGQMLARISHPNVMAVYGAQQVDGRVGIWGEFVSGRTLAAIVKQDGTMSAHEALVFGEAICRALAAAHRSGLLHRDVKAQNVMRERGGRIVLMDFGLGRDLNDAAGAESADLAGTPLYLAPELFTGGRVSVQSDLYSVGVLMFFLVTGTFPIQGATLAHIREAHMSGKRRKLQDLRPDVPTSFVQVIERAIDPSPQHRFESAGTMLAAIAAASQPVAARPASATVGNRAWIVAAAAALVAAGAAAGMLWSGRVTPATGAGSTTLPLPPPAGTYYPDSSWNVPAVSPDGTWVTVLARNSATGVGSLWIRSLRTMELIEVVKTGHPVDPFWSPDGKRVGFFSARGLQTTTLEGPPSDKVYTALESRGGTWSPNGTILYARDPTSGLFRVMSTDPAAEPTLLFAPDRARGELGYMWPQFLPDGEQFIYFVMSNNSAVRGVYLGSLAAGRGSRLAPADASGIVAQGHLLTVSGGALVAWPFDAAARRIRGSSTVVIPSVGVTFDHRLAAAASERGPLVYSPPELSRLTRLDPSGRELEVIGEQTARYRSPALSRDGAYLAVQHYRDGLSRLDILDLSAKTLASIIERAGTTDRAQTASVEFALWGPDNRLAFASNDRGWHDIYTVRVGGEPQLLCQTATDKMPTDWSIDGRELFYNDTSTNEMWVVDTTKAGTSPCPATRLSSPEKAWGRLSPDDRRIAYVSQEAGLAQVWVRDRGGLGRQRISMSGGTDPAWSTANELSFLDRLGYLHIVDLSRGAGRPVRHVGGFQTRIHTPGASRNNYAWEPGGRRVLVNQPQPDPFGTRVAVKTNWSPEKSTSESVK